MAQYVKKTVDMCLFAGLNAMINAHHERWVDNETAFGSQLPRLVSIWSQIAVEFQGYSRTAVVFELLNEPSNITVAQLNTMNAALLPAIRKTNPTRQVHFGGLKEMGAWWILGRPDAMLFPRADNNIALTVHSYTPWSFAGPGKRKYEFNTDLISLKREPSAAASLSRHMPSHMLPHAWCMTSAIVVPANLSPSDSCSGVKGSW